MKTIILSFLLILLSSATHAQELKRVKERNFSKIPFREQNKLKAINVFHVLKSDKNTKHGDYVKYLHKDQLFEKGSYDHNIKAGVWEYYDFDGNLIMKFNHSSSKIEYVNDDLYANFNFDAVEYLNKPSDSYPKNSLGFIGGKDRFVFYLLYDSGFEFPMTSLLAGKLGDSKISFVVTPKGKITQEKIEDSVSDEIDKISVEAIENIPDEFVPYPENKLLKTAVKCFQVFQFK